MAKKVFYFIHADDVEELFEQNPHFDSAEELFNSLTDEVIKAIASKSDKSIILSMEGFADCFNNQKAPYDFLYYCRVI